ncbi:MAG: hypothetical protein GF308_18155 [Candidatus Heimdallarchaeota archaeon]|nr:hypothetical protein [Candidatus Heimdallarchaeota archaeon]
MTTETERGEDKVKKEIAKILINATTHLEQQPMEVYVLKNAEKEIEQIAEEYELVPIAQFFTFFFTHFRKHLWFHIAADSSLRMTDRDTQRIIETVKNDLKSLANVMENDDKVSVFNTLKNLVFNYLVELK